MKDNYKLVAERPKTEYGCKTFKHCATYYYLYGTV